MRFTRLACFVVTSALLGCGGGSDGGTTNPPPPPPGGNQTLGSIQTSVSTMNLIAGNSQTITVTAFDTQNQVISNPGSPTFTSASAAIADVGASSGTVTGISSGTTNVTASLTRGSVTRTATVAVTVSGTIPSQANINTTQGDIFTPSSVTISQGGNVTWTFGITVHNVIFATTPGAPQNIPESSSTSVSRTFAATGTFSYQCNIHTGMNGTVVVR